MIAGEDDKMWDSVDMANDIKSSYPDAEIFTYKDAGHIFGGNGVLNLENIRINMGGEKVSNDKAFKESEEVIEKFLEKQHKK